MSDIVTTDRGTAMLAVIEEIVAGAEGLIRDWPLLAQAQQALREGGRMRWRTSIRTTWNDRGRGRCGFRPRFKRTG